MKNFYCKTGWGDPMNIDDHKKEMAETGESVREVFKVEKVKGTGMFHCLQYDDLFELGLGECNKKYCKHYEPRNGKGGICKHHRIPSGTSDKSLTIKFKENE